MNRSSANFPNNVFSVSPTLLKFGCCFLLLGLAYRLFSTNIVPISPRAVSDDGKYPVSLNFARSCDIFVGRWVQDFNGPRYTNATCSFIEAPQNCIKNGRPDSNYLYWRWRPNDCDLPNFDAKKFLSRMKGKSMALIGDSIMRNHVQSLLCMLSEVEDVIEVYHDESYKNRRWSFPSYNFTVSLVWAPFLTKARIFEDDNGVSSGLIQLHLDQPDTIWTEQYQHLDFVIIAGGKWFLKSALYYENFKPIGCHRCHNSNMSEIQVNYAYRRSLNSTFKFFTESKHKPLVIFRTTTPDHFENGEWDSGGYCSRTLPFKPTEARIQQFDRMMRDIELQEFDMAATTAHRKNGLELRLLDTTWLSALRPDGHPGVYRQFHPYDGKDENAKIQNDCLHWCLPGPIDAWNDLIMEMLSHVSDLD